MATGTVKWFSEEKGYGFISPDEGEEEIFVHYTDVEGEGFRSLAEGERVSYEPATSSRGARRREEAKEVRRVFAYAEAIATGGGRVDGMLRVLVVDDRVDFRQVFAELLDGQPDLRVMGQAGSLAEARSLLEGVDVALLDRSLPDGDGLTLMYPLRDANPHARVLVMSATAEMRHPEDALEAGADGVIDKVGPFERGFALIRGDGGG